MKFWYLAFLLIFWKGKAAVLSLISGILFLFLHHMAYIVSVLIVSMLVRLIIKLWWHHLSWNPTFLLVDSIDCLCLHHAIYITYTLLSLDKIPNQQQKWIRPNPATFSGSLSPSPSDHPAGKSPTPHGSRLTHQAALHQTPGTLGDSASPISKLSNGNPWVSWEITGNDSEWSPNRLFFQCFFNTRG